MSFKVGVGLLIEGEAFNTIRQIQMDIAEVVYSNVGLTQPPHVTVVRPFTIESLDDIRALNALLAATCKKFKAHVVSFSNFASFDTSTLYFQPDDTTFFADMHTELAQRIREQIKTEQNNTDDKEMIFHSTISYKLSDLQFQEGLARLGSHKPSLPVQATISKLGLFLQVDDQWVVVSSFSVSE